MIFHYAFLLDIDFIPDGEMQVMVLEFTNCILTLKGCMMKQQLIAFQSHEPSTIIIINKRYASLAKLMITVFEATVSGKRKTRLEENL